MRQSCFPRRTLRQPRPHLPTQVPRVVARSRGRRWDDFPMFARARICRAPLQRMASSTKEKCCCRSHRRSEARWRDPRRRLHSLVGHTIEEAEHIAGTNLGRNERGASVRSRDWDEVVDALDKRAPYFPATAQPTSLASTSTNRDAAGRLSTTFRAMFLEEAKRWISPATKSSSFHCSGRYYRGIFIGLQFLLAPAPQVSDIDERTFSWTSCASVFTCLCSCLAWAPSRSWPEAIMQRTGSKTGFWRPRLQPLTMSAAHFVLREGFGLLRAYPDADRGRHERRLLLDEGGSFTRHSSGPRSSGPGPRWPPPGARLALAFLGSVLWLRGRPFTWLGPVAPLALAFPQAWAFVGCNLGRFGRAAGPCRVAACRWHRGCRRARRYRPCWSMISKSRSRHARIC